MAYATITDLQARWPGLPDGSHPRATELLGDAAVRIDAEAPPPAPPLELTEHELRARLIVSCGMVERAMKSDGTAGVTQESRTQGPFSSSFTFANPTGDLYLTKADRKLLGIGRQTAFMVDMAGPEYYIPLGGSARADAILGELGW